MTPAAMRMRRYRARRRIGRVVLRIPVDLVQLTETLIGAGFLRPENEDDRAAVERAAAKFLASARVVDVE